MPLRLSPIKYHNLVEVAHSTHAPRQLHRAQALLWLHEGDTVAEGGLALVRYAAPRLPLAQPLARVSSAGGTPSARR
jgi:hypothetical protein